MEFKKDFYLGKLPKEGMVADGIYFIKEYVGFLWNVFIRNSKNTRWMKIGEIDDLTGIQGVPGPVGFEEDSGDLKLQALNGIEATGTWGVELELVDQGDIDCSENPDYPKAEMGDYWKVSDNGKIGGDSGDVVTTANWIVCKADSDGGTKAVAGTDFDIVSTDPAA